MEIRGKTIILEKELNKLGLKILEKFSEYVIVARYLPILFGRARSTEDMDILVPPLKKSKLEKLWKRLEKTNFWCLNSESVEEAFNILRNKLPIRFAKKGEIIPNIELKFYKEKIDYEALKNRVKVLLDEKFKIFISSIELQIAYKEEVLRSKKDLEDALHLREVFKDVISESNIKKMEKIVKMRRKEFIKFWARYVRTHSDKEWSKQQKILIDSQISATQDFYRKNPKIRERILKKFKHEMLHSNRNTNKP